MSNGLPRRPQVRRYPQSGVALPSCKFKAEVGSAVLFDYRLHHRGLANRSTSGESRPLLYLTFGRSWFTDAENFPAKRLMPGGTT